MSKQQPSDLIDDLQSRLHSQSFPFPHKQAIWTQWNQNQHCLHSAVYSIINGLTRFLCFHALQLNVLMSRFCVYEQRVTETRQKTPTATRITTKDTRHKCVLYWCWKGTNTDNIISSCSMWGTWKYHFLITCTCFDQRFIFMFINLKLVNLEQQQARNLFKTCFNWVASDWSLQVKSWFLTSQTF